MPPQPKSQVRDEPEKVSSLPPSPTTLVDECHEDVEKGTQPDEKRSWLLRLFSLAYARSRHDDVIYDHWTPLTKPLDEKPRGYDQVATFKASDRNFLQFRGFGALRCRVLLDLQCEIEQLEESLEEIDAFDKRNGRLNMTMSKWRDEDHAEDDLRNGRYPSHIEMTRPQILLSLRKKLVEYGDLIMKTKEISALQRPAKRDYNSVVNWFRQKEPLIRSEAQYIRRKEDIITLRSGRESARFDGWIESSLSSLDKFLRTCFGIEIVQYLFLTPELRRKSPKGQVQYFAPSRIDALVNIIITVVVFVLLILPVVVMYEVTGVGQNQSPVDAIGILIVFTLVFGFAISSLTTAKRHELFGASAAYAAVLVVFIGNYNTQQVSWMSNGAQPVTLVTSAG